jgi:hypothetical protein
VRNSLIAFDVFLLSVGEPLIPFIEKLKTESSSEVPLKKKSIKVKNQLFL